MWGVSDENEHGEDHRHAESRTAKVKEKTKKATEAIKDAAVVAGDVATEGAHIIREASMAMKGKAVRGADATAEALFGRFSDDKETWQTKFKRWYVLSSLQWFHYVYKTGYGQIWDALMIMLAVYGYIVCASVTFVYEAANRPGEEESSWVTNSFTIINVVLGVDLVLRLHASQAKRAFISRPKNILEAFTVITPGMFAISHKALYIFQATRLLRLHNATEWYDRIGARLVHADVVLIRLFTRIILGIGIFAVWIAVLEPGTVADAYEGFYLAVQTLTTIGFGDVQAEGGQFGFVGRLFVGVSLIFAVLLLPAELYDVYLSTKVYYSRHLGNQDARRPFVLVCGSYNARAMLNLCHEFFSEENQTVQEKLGLGVGFKLKFMRNEPVDEATQHIFWNSHLRDRVEYVHADPKEIADLKRARVHDAKCVLVLAGDLKDTGVDESDSLSVLIAVSVKKCFNDEGLNDFMMYVECHQKSAKVKIEQVGVTHCFCIAEKQGFIAARNMQCPGLSTMLLNLVSTKGDGLKEDSARWIKEYSHGDEFEIFALKIPPEMLGMTFSQCVRAVREKFGCLLFAVLTNSTRTLQQATGVENDEIEDQSYDRCFLAPFMKEYVITRDCVGYVFAKEQPVYWSEVEAHKQVIKYDPAEELLANLVTRTNAIKMQSQKLLPANSLPERVEVAQSALPEDAGPLGVFRLSETTAEQHLNGHIVVIGGTLEAALPFLKRLRSGRDPFVGTAVMVVEVEPTNAGLADASELGPIYWHVGDGHSIADHELCRLLKAKSVYVRKMPKKVERKDLRAVDTIKTMMSINTMLLAYDRNPNIVVDVFSREVGELINYTSNFSSEAFQTPYEDSPMFAAGQLVDFERWKHGFATQLVLKPYLAYMIDILLQGQTFYSMKNRKFWTSQVEQVDVPERLHGKAYGIVFEDMLGSGKLLLGMYRASDVDELSSPPHYVFTSPTDGTIVTRKDKLYAIVTQPWNRQNKAEPPSVMRSDDEQSDNVNLGSMSELSDVSQS